MLDYLSAVTVGGMGLLIRVRSLLKHVVAGTARLVRPMDLYHSIGPNTLPPDGRTYIYTIV